MIADNDAGSTAPRAPKPLEHWESQAVEATGTIIEFWRFKRNQGRVWALLYLRQTPLTAPDLQLVLGLSKGAASMVTRELEHWGVIRRVRAPERNAWAYLAETDLMSMVGRVIRDREVRLVKRIRAELEEAQRLARASGAPTGAQDRLARMLGLAALVDRALDAFQRTAKLDVVGALGLLSRAAPWRKTEMEEDR